MDNSQILSALCKKKVLVVCVSLFLSSASSGVDGRSKYSLDFNYNLQKLLPNGTDTKMMKRVPMLNLRASIVDRGFMIS